MRDPRCSYVILLESAGPGGEDLQDFSAYLSELMVAGCDVVLLDPSAKLDYEARTRVLRWVSRHLAMPPGVDVFRAAAAFSACEKVIVASPDVRYTAEAIGQLCDLLDVHDVVEPQVYADPLPWWGGIEAGRMLMHRAVEVPTEEGATFGFRRVVARRMPLLRGQGHFARHILVRREAGALDTWLARRPLAAGEEFAMPVKTAFFLTLLPLLLLVAVLGGARIAGGYAALIAFSSVALALRGRIGTSPSLPMRACFYAPLSILERSISVYWALLRKLRRQPLPSGREDMPAAGCSSSNVRHG